MTTANSRMPDGLTRRTKLLYGAGDTGFSLTSTILGAYFLIFLTDVIGIAPGIAAVAILIGRSWDYVNDPIVGHISDRTRSRQASSPLDDIATLLVGELAKSLAPLNLLAMACDESLHTAVQEADSLALAKHEAAAY